MMAGLLQIHVVDKMTRPNHGKSGSVDIRIRLASVQAAKERLL